MIARPEGKFKALNVINFFNWTGPAEDHVRFLLLKTKNKAIIFNPGHAGPVTIRFHYACLCGGPWIDPVSLVSSFTL